jgi:hypothetical protein
LVPEFSCFIKITHSLGKNILMRGFILAKFSSFKWHTVSFGKSHKSYKDCEKHGAFSWLVLQYGRFRILCRFTDTQEESVIPVEKYQWPITNLLIFPPSCSIPARGGFYPERIMFVLGTAGFLLFFLPSLFDFGTIKAW